MGHAVVGVFHTPAEAEHAVADMVDHGFQREEINLIGPDSPQASHVEIEGSKVEHVEDMAIGAVGGGLLGGSLGTVVGMVVMAFPGLGPALVEGPFASAIGGAGVTMVVGGVLGALVGGVLGALTWARITVDESHAYETFLKHGGALVVVQAADNKLSEAAEILHHDGALSGGELEAEWRPRG